ncbi:PDZ domain-containing protein, partial [Alicyclobacillus sp.]|uniref:PDZ domain-containing protein n=1 Tax=Alicyclobacillus sp. TaxID=61169 RepID=UPI0025B96816
TLCEALLLALFQTRRLRPVYVLSKRGRAIGAFAMHLAFVLPVWLPLAGTSAAAGLPAWAGAGFTAVPAAIGFGGVFAGLPTRRVLAAVCLRDLGIALLLAAGAFVGRSMGSGWALLALWLAVGTAEGVRLWVDRAEAAADPLFAPSPDGVRVLATLPGSLAEAMGLAPGEVITHVNQIPVHTGYDLHFAFDQNPAYARLRVVDPRGEARLVGKPVYDGERVKLGLLLVPEDGQAPCYPSVPCGLLQTVGLRDPGTGRTPEPPAGVGEPVAP